MMKWFWKINYLVTIYFIIVIPLDLMDGSFGLPNLQKNTILYNIFKIFTINGFSLFLTLIVEWIQFPLCLIAIAFWKQERTKKHFFYLVLLVVFNILKWGLWLFAVSGVVGHAGEG